MPTIRTIKRSSSKIPIEDIQHEQYLYDYASDYTTSEKMLLDEAEQFYNRLLEESISGCTISETAENTLSIHSLQPSELDTRNGHTRDEDQYTNSDSNEDDLITVKVE